MLTKDGDQSDLLHENQETKNYLRPDKEAVDKAQPDGKGELIR